jgi:exodeoxyribonuclease VII small subunit
MAKKPSQPSGPPALPDDLRFEDAVGELEAIVERIESGDVDLDRALREHERGVALIKRCREMLQKAEQRVQQLALHSGEEPVARPAARPPRDEGAGR